MKKNFNLFSLSDREQKSAKAGYKECGCGCVWANCGGSSEDGNGQRNFDKGLFSPDSISRDQNTGNPT